MNTGGRRAPRSGTRSTRTLLFLGATIHVWFLTAGPVAAQLVQNDESSEPAVSQTTQLVTSSTEVRRAVIGLLAVAFLTGLLAIVYWYKTGQLAREQFAREYGGRHAAPRDGKPSPFSASARQPRPPRQPRSARRTERKPKAPRETPMLGAQERVWSFDAPEDGVSVPDQLPTRSDPGR